MWALFDVAAQVDPQVVAALISAAAAIAVAMLKH